MDILQDTYITVADYYMSIMKSYQKRNPVTSVSHMSPSL